MARTHRTHAPNSGVHITARIQGRTRLFTPELRDDVATFIAEAARPCGHRVLAFVVMPNHFHIVLKQGMMPLGWMMQRVMQRTTCLIKRTYAWDGHVFGAPYWSSVCGDITYLRRVIIYTHLNPWKAGLCSDGCAAGEYRWSSHDACLRVPCDAPWADAISTDETRSLFADRSVDADDVTRNYLAFMRCWQKRHLLNIPGDKYIFTPPKEAPPRAELGDSFWATNYSHSYCETRPIIAQIDVRDRAIMVLRRLASDCSIDLIRHAGRIRRLCSIRRELIAALLTFGYRGSAISRCLRVSPSVVSRVAAALERSVATS